MSEPFRFFTVAHDQRYWVDLEIKLRVRELFNSFLILARNAILDGIAIPANPFRRFIPARFRSKYVLDTVSYFTHLRQIFFDDLHDILDDFLDTLCVKILFVLRAITSTCTPQSVSPSV